MRVSNSNEFADLHAVSNFILIGLCIIAGFVLKRLRVLPDDAHKGINIWVLYLAVPAVALKYIPTIHWSNDLLLPALMPVIVWTGSWLTFKLYSLWRPLDRATRTALTLVAGLGNTSFLGFPLVSAYYGEQALPIAVISDQVTFMLMATVGSMMAINTRPHPTFPEGEGLTANPIIIVMRKVLLFPPFIGFIAALVLPHFIDFAPALPVLDKIASTLVPLALFSVGMQLNLEVWVEDIPLLGLSLGYKLLIAPALILVIMLVLNMKGLPAEISLFEAAMAPMITAGVLATQYDLNPRLANLVVGIGILFSFLTTGIWFLIVSIAGGALAHC
ncbi:MAG: transporter [Bacteroidetes bacterium]|nr:transporter [Bacteroidota bacterium]